jgi:hypothetical protein
VSNLIKFTPEPAKIIRLIDRTRTVTDWKCPRARYWGYEYQGRGIVKNSTSLELSIGIAVHDALAAIASLTLANAPVNIDEIATATYTQIHDLILETQQDLLDRGVGEFAKEQGTLGEGLIRGFYHHVWPKLMQDHQIVCAEEEMEYPLYQSEGLDIIFMTKPDLILENKDGDLIYIEYKTTSTKKEAWINSWDTAVQLHSSVKATEFSLGKLPAAVQIVGLYKGYESYGKQSSPFCYAYTKKGNPPFSQDQVAYEYAPGFKRTPTWEHPGGVKAWIENMPNNVMANQFPMTPPIFVNEDLVARFFKQRLNRELDIAATHDVVEGPMMDIAYPQRFDQCQPSFGWPCQYKTLCHGHVEDPLNSGFVPREPHHQTERDQLGLDAHDQQ